MRKVVSSLALEVGKESAVDVVVVGVVAAVVDAAVVAGSSLGDSYDCRLGNSPREVKLDSNSC
jgi:hypothetical protein